MARQTERRATERSEDAEKWTDDERKTMTKVGGLFEKWNKRHGTPKQEKKEKSFLEEIGISL